VGVRLVEQAAVRLVDRGEEAVGEVVTDGHARRLSLPQAHPRRAGMVSR